MKRVLVTGGAGFIGSNLVRFLLHTEPDCRVITLDALTYAGRRENLDSLPDPSRHRLVVGNICDRELVDRLLVEDRVDTIIHLAAESHVDRSIHAPETFIQTNVVGTHVLLDSARRAGGVRFHHVSTDEVFGSLGPGDPAFTESTPYAPNSPYAASKAASDHLVRAYARTYGLEVTITNCSNNYGPYQFPEKLIPLFILNALAGQALPLYGDGQQVRDWLFVTDHCEAIHAVVTRGRPGETYNVGGDNQPTNLELAQQVCAWLDELHPHSPYRPHAQLITHVADRPGHDRRYAMNISKIRAELGWSPRFALPVGLRTTVQWYLDHLEWVASVRRQGTYQEWLQRNYHQREERP